MNIREIQAAIARRNYTPHWTMSQWGCALAGEVGEACNIIKKIDRGDFVNDLVHGRQLLAGELSDVLAYLCLTADAYGIDLDDAYKEKFNEVSKRIDSDIML